MVNDRRMVEGHRVFVSRDFEGGLQLANHGKETEPLCINVQSQVSFFGMI